jgi:hypothetical protein
MVALPPLTTPYGVPFFLPPASWTYVPPSGGATVALATFPGNVNVDGAFTAQQFVVNGDLAVPGVLLANSIQIGNGPSTIGGSLSVGGALGFPGAAFSVRGNPNPAAGASSDIVAAVNGAVLQRTNTGSGLVFGLLDKANMANTFYQEVAPWTPTATFGGAAVGIAYSTQLGLMVRIGRVIFFTMRLGLASKGTSTGQLLIGGLPITSTPTANAYFFFSTSFGSVTGNLLTKTFGANIAPNASSINFLSQDGTLNIVDTDCTNNSFFNASGFYMN